MSNAGKTLIAIGATSAAIAVALGAFAAHGLKQNISPEMLSIFETAARYQMYPCLCIDSHGICSQYVVI